MPNWVFQNWMRAMRLVDEYQYLGTVVDNRESLVLRHNARLDQRFERILLVFAELMDHHQIEVGGVAFEFHQLLAIFHNVLNLLRLI